MRCFKLCLYIMLSMSGFVGYNFAGKANTLQYVSLGGNKLFMQEQGEKFQKNSRKEDITPMKALDQVKELYAVNFEKVYDGNSDEYYYKLPTADYYLVYEGMESDPKYYLMHLYEFVLDEPETGIGHTVTYGWYTVEKETGKIKDNSQ